MEKFIKVTCIDIAELLLILFLGVIAVKLLTKIIKRTLLQSSIDNSIVGFILSSVDIFLYFGLIMIIASHMGVPLATFATILAAASVAISLAVKDSLSNVANGLILVSTKPFKIGDHVKVGSVEGKIKNVKLLHTELLTFDNKKIVIPNNLVYNSEIVNYSANPIRRVDMSFQASYGSDVDYVVELLKNIVSSQPQVLKTPAPVVRFSEQADNALVFQVRVWAATTDYWDTYFEINERGYKEFSKNNIEIPYAQLDVHIREEK